LKKFIQRGLNQGIHIAIFLPDKDIRNPTWTELQDFATEAYAAALSDVLNALEGNAYALEQAVSEDGRFFVRDKDKDILMERMEETKNRRVQSLLESGKNLEDIPGSEP
jgi:hypothetical protein